MSTIKETPQPAGILSNVTGCSACGADHEQVSTFTDSQGRYFICVRRLLRVDVLAVVDEAPELVKLRHWADLCHSEHRVGNSHVRTSALELGNLLQWAYKTLQHRAASHATGEAGEALSSPEVETFLQLVHGATSPKNPQLEILALGDLAGRYRNLAALKQLGKEVAALRAALTPAPAQTPQTAAPRCSGGGVGHLKEQEVEALKFAADELREQAPGWAKALGNVLKRYAAPRTCRTCPAAGDAGEAQGTEEGGSHA